MRNDIDEQLQDKAIEAALKGDWKEAVSVNTKLLDMSPDDVDVLLRLGYAHLQNGNLKEAKKAYMKGLKSDPSSHIARANLDKIKILEKKKDTLKKVAGKNQGNGLAHPSMFINIRGKTQVFSLVHIGQADTLAILTVGQTTKISIKKRRIEVRTDDGDYIGAFPDDISKRLMLFLKAGSDYEAYIKEASKSHVDIFIREVKLGKKVARFISFPKNMADDIKTMEEQEEEEEKSQTKQMDGNDDEDDSESEESDNEQPVDLDELAEEAAETEFYPSDTSSVDDDEDEE